MLKIMPLGALEIVEVLQNRGHQAFLVGGCVRDSLLGKEPKDWDIATDARPEDVTGIFDKVIPTGIDFGTVTVLRYGDPYEVTTFRGDGAYTDGRRPDVVSFKDRIEDDLSRRDFTINAMAYDPVSHRLVDPFGGQVDLQAGIIRCVGEAPERFGEDRLRVLRAIRFATVLDFEMEAGTETSAWSVLYEGLNGVAAERRQVEFMKTLMSPHAERKLAAYFESCSGLWDAYGMEETDEDLWFTNLRAVPPLPMLKLAHIFTAWEDPDIAKVLKNLKMPSGIIYTVPILVRFKRAARHLGPGSWSAEVRDLLRSAMDVKIDIRDVLRLLEADGQMLTVRRIERVLATDPPVTYGQLALKGDDVARITGLQGRGIGEALRYLLHEVVDDPTRNTPEGLTKVLNDWGRR